MLDSFTGIDRNIIARIFNPKPYPDRTSRTKDIDSFISLVKAGSTEICPYEKHLTTNYGRFVSDMAKAAILGDTDDESAADRVFQIEHRERRNYLWMRIAVILLIII